VPSLIQRCGAEFVGTLLLLATVVGSGIMAENLAEGNTAIALLGNTIPTGAILYVLITTLGPVSGAHFNPAVTLVFWLKRQISLPQCVLYLVVQILGALLGALLAHLMFELEPIQISTKIRTGPAQWLSESVATFGLVFVILSAVEVKKESVAACVGLYITAAYWFTASTSFANPAVTLARSFTDTFAGINPMNTPAFVVAQLVGAGCAALVFQCIFNTKNTSMTNTTSITKTTSIND
jgi:glycerol uptake facilitator-like aquaporin